MLLISLSNCSNRDAFQLSFFHQHWTTPIPLRRLYAQSQDLALTVPEPTPSDSLENVLDDFHRTLAVNPFDAMQAARIHMDIIFQLVRSDVQYRNEDDGSETHAFPASYYTALSFITNTLSLLKESEHPLYSSANMIAKKESLTQLARLVRTVVMTNRLMSSREIVEAKRKIERVLSQLMILSIGYRSCSAMKTAGINCIHFHLPHVHILLLFLSRYVCILAATYPCNVIITASLTTIQHTSINDNCYDVRYNSSGKQPWVKQPG